MRLDTTLIVSRTGHSFADFESPGRAGARSLFLECDIAIFHNDETSITNLPRRAPSATPPAFSGIPNLPKLSRQAKDKRRSRKRSRILVVDDVADVTEMISLFLKHAGYQVTTADSASAALRRARTETFDLVISDIGMPQMNGYELAGQLRALEKYERVPMIAVTGYTEYDDRGRSVRAGFNAHLTKPIDPAVLLKLIQELLS
jgi:CheY-like chemotaxis protein